MSWLFSQALVAAFSAAISSDGAPSVPLSVMPTQHKFWRNDKTMEFSRLSQFGLTCAVLTEDHGAALLTWYLEASRARTSAAQTPQAKESTAAAAGFGANSQESLARFDQSSSSWKIPQHSLFGDSIGFSEIWPRWGLMLAGVCFRLAPLEPHTHGSACGFWPTPRASDRDNCGGSNARKKAMATGNYVGRNQNPQLQEWLMGWPIGWTGLEPVETARFQTWLLSHSEPSTAA